MRIVFMGSPDFSVPSLDALIEGGHEIVAAYAQPPRPAGRGKADRKTAVHERAEQLGIPVRTPRSLKDPDEQERLRELDADFGIVAAYGLMLPKPVLEAPRNGCVNVHASLLPRWRGAAPIQRAILAGDEVTGITLMQMDEGLDTGAILLASSVTIERKTAGELTAELAKLGGTLLQSYLRDRSAFAPRCQPDEGVTYARKLDKQEAALDFTQDARAVERQVRAFNPAPGSWFEYLGERIKVWEAEVVDCAGLPGVVADACLTISCGESAIRPVTVQRAGKARMYTDELLRGFPIPIGAKLITPEAKN